MIYDDNKYFYPRLCKNFNTKIFQPFFFFLNNACEFHGSLNLVNSKTLFQIFECERFRNFYWHDIKREFSFPFFLFFSWHIHAYVHGYINGFNNERRVIFFVSLLGQVSPQECKKIPLCTHKWPAKCYSVHKTEYRSR